MGQKFVERSGSGTAGHVAGVTEIGLSGER